MGIVLLLSVVALAALVGWIAYWIEKWLGKRHSPHKAKKTESPFPRPSETTYKAPSANCEEPLALHSNLKAEKRNQAPKIEPIGIEDRFDNWQGTGAEKYPPDWRFRSAVVRQRDGDRCQVAGCPSIGVKHVHHLDSISNGGTHALPNLITLCEFHHALMPDHLEAIGESLDSARFRVRRGHSRRNLVNPGLHDVRPSIVRYVSASKQDIELLVGSFGRPCPRCPHHEFEFSARQEYTWAQFNSDGRPISCDWRLVCQNCGCAWYFQGGLLEEIGLILGRLFSQPSNPKLASYENAWLEDFDFVEAPACRRTDCLGHQLWRRNRSDGSHFIGCSEYFETGCKAR